ncbi:MAG: MGMT family protein [Thermomicrobiales bacterium]
MSENPSDPSGFAERVYAVVEAIPYGRVTTYGLIARALGAPRSARIVGGALQHTPEGRTLPAHRVVNRQGFLSGGWHFGHPDIMRDRLLAEGVPFKNLDEYIVDLAQVLWDPGGDPDLDRVYRPPDASDDFSDLDDAPFRIVDVND